MPDPAFHDVRLPTDISRDATGGPNYLTTVMPTPGGREQRQIEWDESLLKWSIDLTIWSPERLEALLAFFHCRMGRGYAFRFKDWTDYFVGMAYATGGVLVYDAERAQTVGTGDGATKAFQLSKRYVSGPTTRVRKIPRPIAATVKVYFVTGGGAPVERTAGWTLDDTTGQVIFTTAPPVGTDVRWAGQFDVPARFDTDGMGLNMKMIHSGRWPSIPVVGVKE